MDTTLIREWFHPQANPRTQRMVETLPISLWLGWASMFDISTNEVRLTIS